MKEQFLEIPPTLVIFEILREIRNVPIMFEKEHKNDHKNSEH